MSFFGFSKPAIVVEIRINPHPLSILPIYHNEGNPLILDSLTSGVTIHDLIQKVSYFIDTIFLLILQTREFFQLNEDYECALFGITNESKYLIDDTFIFQSLVSGDALDSTKEVFFIFSFNFLPNPIRYILYLYLKLNR
jgi:hypothetical protein